MRVLQQIAEDRATDFAESLSDLVAMLRIEDAQVRIQVFLLLETLIPIAGSSIDSLKKLLCEPIPHVRQVAALLIAKLVPAEKSLYLAIAALPHEDPEIRASAAHELAGLGSAAGIAVYSLTSILEHEKVDQVRGQVLYALAKIEKFDEKTIELLREIASEDAGLTSRFAQAILEKWESQQSNTDQGRLEPSSMTLNDHMRELHRHLVPGILGWLVATLACSWRVETGWYGKMVVAVGDGLLVVFPLIAVQLYRFARSGLHPRERLPVFLVILFGPPIVLGILTLLLAPLERLYGDLGVSQFRVMMPKAVTAFLVLLCLVSDRLIHSHQRVSFPLRRVAFWMVLLLPVISLPAWIWSFTQPPVFICSVLFAIWPQLFLRLPRGPSDRAS